MGWDWASKNWKKRLGIFKKLITDAAYQSKEKTGLGRVKKNKVGEIWHLLCTPSYTVCAASAKWASRGFWWKKRTMKGEGLVSVLNLRHGISRQELLSHGPKQCLWEQKADADLEESSRASITHYVTAEKISGSSDIPNLLIVTRKNVTVMKISYSVVPHHGGWGRIEANHSSFFINFSFPLAHCSSTLSLGNGGRLKSCKYYFIAKIIRSLGCMGIEYLPEEKVASLCCPYC